MMKKCVSLLMILIMGTLLLTGCGSKPSAETAESGSEAGAQTAEKTEKVEANTQKEDVVITAMFLQSQNYEGLQNMVQKLEEEEGIILDAQVVPDDQFQSMVQMKQASGELPDIFQYNIPHVYNLFDPEETFYDLSDEEWTSRLINPEVSSYNGKTYGFPFLAINGYQAMLYNKDVFDANGISVPTTVEEFDAACETLKAAGITPIALASDPWVPQIYTTSGMTRAMGSIEANVAFAQSIYSGEKTFNDYPVLADVIDEMISLKTKGYFNDDIATLTFDDALIRLGEGEVAMFMGAYGMIGRNQSSFPDTNFGIFNRPTSYDDQDILSAAVFSSGLVVKKDSENIDAVLRMLELFSTPEYGNLYFANGNAGFPAFEGVDGGELQPDIRALFDKHVEAGTLIPEMNLYLNKFEALNADLWAYYAEALNKGTLNGTQVLEKYQEDCDKFMKENGF